MRRRPCAGTTRPRTLRAEDGRAAVIAPLGELEQEVHLLGGRHVDEVFVEDELLEGRKLVRHLLYGPSRGELLGAIGQHVGHADVEDAEPALAGPPTPGRRPDAYGRECSMRELKTYYVRASELRGQVPESGGARERLARGLDAGEAHLPDCG